MTAGSTDWTMVAALAQTAGSAATLLAVWVALRLAREERLIRLRVEAKFMVLMNEQGSTDLVMVSVDNVGLRRAIVTGLYWSTGYRRIFVPLPSFLALRGAAQNEDWDLHINEKMPWSIDPGESKATYFQKEEFLKEFAKHQSGDLFRKHLLFRRHFLLNHRVGVGVKTIDRVVTGRVSSTLTKEIETRYELNNP